MTEIVRISREDGFGVAQDSEVMRWIVVWWVWIVDVKKFKYLRSSLIGFPVGIFKSLSVGIQNNENKLKKSKFSFCHIF